MVRGSPKPNGPDGTHYEVLFIVWLKPAAVLDLTILPFDLTSWSWTTTWTYSTSFFPSFNHLF